MIILKFTKNQGFTLYLHDTFFGKPQGVVKLTPPAIFGLNQRHYPSRQLHVRSLQ